MDKVEIYSILLTFEGRQRWNLDGFKHHVVPGNSRKSSLWVQNSARHTDVVI